MNLPRTDLALECHEFLTEAACELSGVSVVQEEREQVRLSRVRIETPEAEVQMGKPMGTYITLEFSESDTLSGDGHENLCYAVAEALQALLPLEEKGNILVVGLGNRDITPDALGPAVLSRLMVTRHLFQYMPEAMDDRLRSVSALAPGVLGITGIETEEIVKGLVAQTKPRALLAIDALAARSTERIGSTIQLCDTGINPGAGVGNRRRALNQETLGIPVIALGVPTVIDAATIAADTLRTVMDSSNKAEIDRDSHFELFRDTLPQSMKDFIVTPKEIDLILARISGVLAYGINLALHKNLTFSDIDAFIS